jgi:hypothetical protein
MADAQAVFLGEQAGDRFGSTVLIVAENSSG